MMRVDTHLQEFHNQFIFSKEAKELRVKFSGVLNNIYYTPENKENNFNTKTLTKKICNSLKKPELHNDLLQIIEQPEALKVLLAFFLKGFTWNREIRERFTVANTFFVDKTMSTLKKHRLVIQESGEDIHPHYFEIIKKCNQNQFRKSLGQAQFLFLTPDLIKLGFSLYEYYTYLIETDLGVGKSLKSVIKNTQIFIKEYERIEREESTRMTRRHITDDGILYEVETDIYKSFQEDLKQSLAELRVERLEKKAQQKQLTDQQCKALAEVKEHNNPLAIMPKSDIEKYKETGRISTTLNGKKLSALEEQEYFNNFKKQEEEITKAPIKRKSNLAYQDVKMNNNEDVTMQDVLFSNDHYSPLFDILGINKSGEDLVGEESKAKSNGLINYVKTQKKVDYNLILKKCGCDVIFNYFCQLATENNITTDMDYFYFRGAK